MSTILLAILLYRKLLGLCSHIISRLHCIGSNYLLGRDWCVTGYILISRVKLNWPKLSPIGVASSRLPAGPTGEPPRGRDRRTVGRSDGQGDQGHPLLTLKYSRSFIR